MDREQLAARIGSRYVRNAMFVGLGCAALVLILMSAGTLEGLIVMIGLFPAQAIICCVMGPLIGHFGGGWAGKKILLNGWKAWLVSPLVGCACVWTTTFLFSMVAYFDEGIHGSHPEYAVRDYILDPLLSVTFFGGLFILLTGLVMAAFFERARRKHFPA
jgi:hypothetical protein